MDKIRAEQLASTLVIQNASTGTVGGFSALALTLGALALDVGAPSRPGCYGWRSRGPSGRGLGMSGGTGMFHIVEKGEFTSTMTTAAILQNIAFAFLAILNTSTGNV